MNSIVLSMTKQNCRYVLANAAGISHEESMRQSPGGANGFNWIVGHIAYWRNAILGMAGVGTVWPEGQGGAYRGNPGERKPLVFDPAEALSLDQLTSDLQTMQSRLDDWLGAEQEVTLPENFLNLLSHEAYHAGQLGVLRRILGREGVI